MNSDNSTFNNWAIAGYLALTTLFSASTFAGPFPPAAGQPGSTAVDASSSAIVNWATGYTQYSPGTDVDPQFQTPARALGPAGDSDGTQQGFIFDIVALGRGGSIDLLFSTPITNGPGNDFAVFENSFSDGFLELAWVEVSSNGVDFERFANVSLTPAPVAPFANIDTTDIFGYGGKYRGGFGTPFNLDDVTGNPAVDINQITHVRIIDIVGHGSAMDTLPPPSGPSIIYDPYPTTGSAGFDLEAIAVMNQVEGLPSENVPVPPTALALLALALGSIASRRRLA